MENVKCMKSYLNLFPWILWILALKHGDKFIIVNLMGNKNIGHLRLTLQT